MNNWLSILKMWLPLLSAPGSVTSGGHLHERQGNTGKALEHYLSVLEDLPRDTWVHLRTGILQEQQGDQEQALFHYKIASDAYPDSFRILFRRSIVTMNLLQEEESIRIHQKMIELRPEHALSLNNLAWMYLTAKDRILRKPEKALELAMKSVELEGDHRSY
ncbi:MAG: tetratricopeptide repeat protein [bacterium]